MSADSSAQQLCGECEGTFTGGADEGAPTIPGHQGRLRWGCLGLDMQDEQGFLEDNGVNC